MRAPKRAFGEWVGEGDKVSKSWLCKLRKWVIIINKPCYSCEPEALIIEAAKLVSNSLGDG
jgi:hypothetical protein